MKKVLRKRVVSLVYRGGVWQVSGLPRGITVHVGLHHEEKPLLPKIAGYGIGLCAAVLGGLVLYSFVRSLYANPYGTTITMAWTGIGLLIVMGLLKAGQLYLDTQGMRLDEYATIMHNGSSQEDD